MSKTQVSNDLYQNLKTANSGDWAAVDRLRQQLIGPDASEIIQTVGNLASQVEESILSSMLGDQEGSKACVRAKLSQMRSELGWAESSTIERMLIERIALTWLNSHCVELQTAQADSVSLPQAKFNQLRCDRAQARYLAAIKTLATVRKLALPIKLEIDATVNVNETKSPAFNRFGELNLN